MSDHQHPLGEPAVEPYHDDPTMSSSKYDDDADATDARSPGFITSPVRDSPRDIAPPRVFSIRSSVPLLPTPGTLSQRHPTYVRYSPALPDQFPGVLTSLLFVQEPLTLRFWIVTSGCVLLGALGIGLEVVAAISKDNNGVFHTLFDSWPCVDPIYCKASTSPRRMYFPSRQLSS